MSAIDFGAEMSENGENPSPTRATAALVPQPHGGAIYPPTPARGGGPAPQSWRRLQRETRDLLRGGTPQGARRILELIQDEDGRTAIVAIREMREWLAAGLVIGDDASLTLDLSHLSQAEADELGAALATVRRLTGRE